MCYFVLIKSCYCIWIAIDAIIGCGQRNGKKYFLVRYKGDRKNDIIDWETAKRYSLEVMEYFGSRLVWSALDNIIGDDELADVGENPGTDRTQSDHSVDASFNHISGLDNLPNEIEYSK